MTTPEHSLIPFARGDHAKSREHARVVETSLPAWLTRAPSPMRMALRASQVSSEAARVALGHWLAALQGLDSFAQPLLAAALKPLAPGIDVRTDVLARLRNVGSLSVPRQHMSRQTLLHAALQNFSDEEYFEPGSLLLPGASLVIEEGGLSYRYPPAKALPISVSAFAATCRALDIGQAYQAHLKTFLEPAQHSAKALFLDNDRRSLEVQAHIARLRNDIDEPAYRALLDLVQGRAASWERKPLRVSALSLMQSSMFSGGELHGPLLLDTTDDGACVLYVPQEPTQPLKQYPSLQAAHDALREKLRSRDYRRFWRRFVSQRHATAFLDHLKDRLTPLVSTFPQAPQRAPDAAANLYLQRVALAGEVFAALHQQRVARMLDDARVMATPTADIDARERDERNRAWLSAGLDLLGLTALFIPGLGELMLACAAAQLVNEVYTGVQDWRHGDAHAAFIHAMDVSENLATLAVMSGAVKLAQMPSVPRWPQGPVFDELVPVRLPNGRERLHRPTLDGYEHSATLPPQLSPDPDGLYVHDGHELAVVTGKVYATRYDSEQRAFRVIHPSARDAYEPLLAKDAEGLWQLAAQQTVAVRGQALRSLANSSLAYLDDARLNLAFHCAGVEPALIEQTFAPGSRVSALLRDTLVRFGIDRAIAQHRAGVDITDPGLAFKLAEPFAPLAGADDDLALFEALYEASHFGGAGASAVLRRDFPSIPVGVAEEILSRVGPAAQQAIVSARRLPLELAERARDYQQALRLNRALEGLCSPSRANVDSAELARRLKVQLPAEASAAQVRDAGLSDREQCAYWLKQHPPAAHFNGPVRDEMGRLGYAMSGRRPTAAQLTQAQLLDMVKRTYRGMRKNDAIVFVRGLGHRRGYEEAMAVLQALEASRLELNLSLDYWVQAQPSAAALARFNGDVVELRHHRREAASRLAEAWQRNGPPDFERELLGFPLDLQELPLIDLPPLLGGFNWVQSLNLRNCHIDAQGLADLLFNFPRLHTLRLNGVGLETLPDLSRQQATLKRLDLGGNHLVVDQVMLDRLGQLPELETLSLNGNAVLGVAQATGFSHLYRLDLANSMIGAWPAWLENLPMLRSVDLSGSGLTQLPPQVLTAQSTQPMIQVELHGNLLPVALQRQIALARFEGRRFNLQFVAPHVQAQAPDYFASPWLVGLDTEQQAAYRQYWAHMGRKSDMTQFIRLLDQMRRVPEFVLNPGEVRRRVLQVVRACALRELLRRRLANIARDALPGEEGLLLAFSEMEVEVYRAEPLVLDSPAARREWLVNRARLLFRARQIALHGEELVEQRRRTGSWFKGEALLLQLRTELGTRMALPGQPLHRVVAGEGGLTAMQLDAVQAAVGVAEGSDEFIRYLIGQESWRTHLHRQYHEQFTITPSMGIDALCRQLTRQELALISPPLA